MKPLRIEFSAFGSFPGEVSVDFTVLAARGLFVVTGDTGTGKTTVFDAMSYALFGEMPSKDGNDIRSHHADPSAQTYARFTFELDGHVHVAERAPEYQRAKQRGTGTTREPAKGMFVRIEGADSTKELASGIRDMNRVVPEVIGLDAAQFRRVMLLPQGEVARFLLDDSANREALLGALFGGDIYTRIGEVLEEEARSLRTQVHESEEKIRHHTTNALARLSSLHTLLEIEPPEELTKPEPGPPIGHERLGQIAAMIDAPYGQLLSDAEARRSDAEKARRAAEAAENTIKRMREATEARRELDALAEVELSVRAKAEAAEASRLARPVLTAEDRFKVAEQWSARASGELAKLTGEIHQIAVEHGLTVPTDPPGPHGLADPGVRS
jgi:DNA repair protein SbcC/Rad50